MSYAAFASAGSSLIQGWATRRGMKIDQQVSSHAYQMQQRIQGANNLLADSEAMWANKLRAGQNRIVQAQANAENTIRKMNNLRLLKQGQAEHEAATINFQRNQDTMMQQDLESQIRNAEARGAYAASSALSGTLGSTVDGMEQTLGLKLDREQSYRDRQNSYVTYDQLRQIAGIVPMAIGGQDVSRSIPMLDYGYNFSQAQALGPDKLIQPRIPGNFLTDILGWANKNPDGFRQAGDTISSWFKPSNPYAANVNNPFAAINL